jgi:hypothetical protein
MNLAVELMMHAWCAVLGLMVSLSAGSVCADATTAPAALGDTDSIAHLRDAESIAHEIDAAHNEYAHQDCFIRWKGEDGAKIYENRTDCSDFLNLLLEHSYHITPDDLYRLTDTRRQPDGSVATGVGEGILRLYSNPDGSIAGYAWSVLGRSKFQSRDVHKIVIGRIQVQRIHPDR